MLEITSFLSPHAFPHVLCLQLGMTSIDDTARTCGQFDEAYVDALKGSFALKDLMPR
jgi:hypothetical protein